MFKEICSFEHLSIQKFVNMTPFFGTCGVFLAILKQKGPKSQHFKTWVVKSAV